MTQVCVCLGPKPGHKFCPCKEKSIWQKTDHIDPLGSAGVSGAAEPPEDPMPRVSGWRDIATAPRDGSVILLFDPIDGVVAGWWDSDETRFPWRFLDRPCSHPAGSIESDGFSTDYPPSAWQPLPEPPQ